jgi:hypothetical protein
MRVALVLVPFLGSLGTLVACGHMKADAAWTEAGEEKRAGRGTEVLGEEPELTSADGGVSTALLGVRHDLGLPEGQHTARCNCLAVEVGEARDKRFRWQASVPDVGNDAMVIAISPRGVTCPGGEADEGKRRGSISAVDRDGADVLVEVEEVPEGRPIASGAVIPRPGAGGSVYVRPKNRKIPYARTEGTSRCKVL